MLTIQTLLSLEDFSKDKRSERSAFTLRRGTMAPTGSMASMGQMVGIYLACQDMGQVVVILS